MRSYELECVHGVGHSGGVHGCDGCCGLIGEPVRESERERIIKLLEDNQGSSKAQPLTYYGYASAIALIKGEEQ